MKLSPSDIEKIEALLSFVMTGAGQRATIIEFNLYDVATLSGFLTTLRRLGVNIPKKAPRVSGLSPEDHKAFVEFLKQSHAAQDGAA